MSENFQFPSWMGEYPRQSAPYCDAECKEMVYSFKHTNMTLQEIAKRHGRQPGAIDEKIYKLIGDSFFLRSQRESERMAKENAKVNPPPCPPLVELQAISAPEGQYYNAVEGGMAPKYPHADQSTAIREAQRLCLNQRRKVHVYKLVAIVEPTPIPAPLPPTTVKYFS